MRGAIDRASRTPPPAPAPRTAHRAPRTVPGDAGIVRPGVNCWRVDRADRFRSVQDGADYFRFARRALLDARDTVFLLGWDILASVDLLPPSFAPDEPRDAPTRLDELLVFVARRRPRLRIYILIWDYAALYTLERDPFSRWRLGWLTPRVRFGFDDRHPVGGSHHQKILVVDDRLAFCGGIDLTGHRWDTSEHRVEEPDRVSTGGPYGPYHEVQAMVSGPVAAALGELARERWRALGESRMPPVRPAAEDRWPVDAEADLTGVDVAIARTVPGFEAQPAIREAEALFLDSIAMAGESIYIESQYFTNDTLCRALAGRLREPDGPEVLVVTPRSCEGWLERSTMGAFREDVFRQLLDADLHRRLRLVYPAASRAQDVVTFIHSKVMVVDDALVRIGSANFSRRSMGVDTECDLAVDARGDARVREGIRRIRDRMLAEHLGLSAEEMSRCLQRAGSLRALVDSCTGRDRTLVRIDVVRSGEAAPSEALRAVADPGEPIRFASPVAQLVPPVDAANGRMPMRIWIVPALALAVAAVSASSLLRPGMQSLQQMLTATAAVPGALWIGAAAFLAANLALVPFEVTAIAAGLFFGAGTGTVVALAGSMAGAVAGYVAGRAIGPAGLSRWMSRRSYRSVRQFAARGIVGVLVLRLASVASAGSIHLLCGAGRVPVSPYLAGTAIALVPAALALAGLGALLRHALLWPSVAHASNVAGAALLLVACAAALRAFLLNREFAPTVSRHRDRAEFG